MVKRLVWSKKALENKKEIFEYWNIANGNKNYSRKLNTELNNLIDVLLSFPDPGRKVENYDARFLVKHRYIIFYKVNRSSEFLDIEIIQIWDSRRDPEDLKL
jgi:toxin YoeB